MFKKPKIFRRNHFVDDECDASDGSSDEEHESDGELNSIICNEEVHDDTLVDMRAIYLQSVKWVKLEKKENIWPKTMISTKKKLFNLFRSPSRKNGYKMSNPREYRHNSNIFSQAVIEDESDYDVSPDTIFFFIFHF